MLGVIDALLSVSFLSPPSLYLCIDIPPLLRPIFLWVSLSSSVSFVSLYESIARLMSSFLSLHLSLLVCSTHLPSHGVGLCLCLSGDATLRSLVSPSVSVCWPLSVPLFVSPYVSQAYLIIYEGHSFRSSYLAVRRHRPIARPNVGFIQQLLELEARILGGPPPGSLSRRGPHPPGASSHAQEHPRGALSQPAKLPPVEGPHGPPEDARNERTAGIRYATTWSQGNTAAAVTGQGPQGGPPPSVMQVPSQLQHVPVDLSVGSSESSNSDNSKTSSSRGTCALSAATTSALQFPETNYCGGAAVEGPLGVSASMALSGTASSGV